MFVFFNVCLFRCLSFSMFVFFNVCLFQCLSFLVFVTFFDVFPFFDMNPELHENRSFAFLRCKGAVFSSDEPGPVIMESQPICGAGLPERFNPMISRLSFREGNLL